jgi:hypothetical protein
MWDLWDLAEKEEIAKRMIEGSDSYSVSVYEEECNEDELEHRVHIMLTENGWTVDLSIVFDETNNKAVRLYCEGADCDIQIEYDQFGHPMLGYVIRTFKTIVLGSTSLNIESRTVWISI